MSKSWKDHSRVAWHTTNETSNCCSDERLKLGLLQRIADALEALNQPFCTLLADRKRWQELAEQRAAELVRLERSRAGLRGYLKRTRTRKGRR